ncbi:hypothetical protein B0H34DRAFT_794487 [Crassisporium funariophilum]|nr:hypothetical protein B0H34DRAFT_794487 [Crassisporium funariophilum]
MPSFTLVLTSNQGILRGDFSAMLPDQHDSLTFISTAPADLMKTIDMRDADVFTSQYPPENGHSFWRKCRQFADLFRRKANNLSFSTSTKTF